MRGRVVTVGVGAVLLLDGDTVRVVEFDGRTVVAYPVVQPDLGNQQIDVVQANIRNPASLRRAVRRRRRGR